MLKIKFCSTGLSSETRRDVSNKINKMGGFHEVNLLSDSKFLIVGSRDSDKFRYCIRNRYDIRFIVSKDIDDMFNKWLNNETFNPYDYEMPAFANLKVCLSRIQFDEFIKEEFGLIGINEIQKKLTAMVESKGGTISNSLSFTDKYIITNDFSGKKYNMAQNWNIPVLHPMWIVHSFRRNATYEVNDYLPSALNKIKEISLELNKKRSRDDFEKNDDDNEDEKKELIIKRKNPKIWESIMSNSIITNNSLKLNEWDDKDDDEIKNFNKNIKTFNSVSIPKVSNSSILNPKPVDKSSNLFKDKKFLIKFFNLKQLNLLKKVIESHNGIILNEESNDLNYLIIPSDFEIDQIPPHFKKYLILTEWFIERSLFYSKIKIDQWGKPFFKTFSKNLNFLKNYPKDGLNVAITGFQGIELLHLTKIIENLLIIHDNYSKNIFNLKENLNKTIDLLIINIDLLNLSTKSQYLIDKNPSLFSNQSEFSKSSLNSTHSKLKFSKSNHIPILTISYLFEFFLIDHNSEEKINIDFKDWCLYCPNNLNINDNLKKLLSSYKEEENEEEIYESLPKLPSPIRNKRNNNSDNLRLIGRAKVSHLDQKFDAYSNSQIDDDHENNIRTTQISYENNENLIHENDLNNFKKRTTRGTYRELMNLGNEEQ